jgi:hypothetical protein
MVIYRQAYFGEMSLKFWNERNARVFHNKHVIILDKIKRITTLGYRGCQTFELNNAGE